MAWLRVAALPKQLRMTGSKLAFEITEMFTAAASDLQHKPLARQQRFEHGS
jgi:hypothetical protein